MLACACVAIAAASACTKQHESVRSEAGRLTHAGSSETSGMAASRRSKDLLWTHSDSSGQAKLFAVSSMGRLRGSVQLRGTKAYDWEDICSFELDGNAWLLVADVGDNKGTRKQYTLHVLAEPDIAALLPNQTETVSAAWTLSFIYEDGTHDCEAVAVDAQTETVYLLTNRTNPPALYSLPLRPSPGTEPLVAKRVVQLPQLPQPSATERILPTPSGRYRSRPTALDFAPDRSAAAVLTYGDVLLFPRAADEKWADALRRDPIILPQHGLPQAEALCFSQDGRFIFVTGEAKNPQLLRYTVPPSHKRQ